MKSFKAFVPITSFEKSVDDEGKEIMKIKGCASTNSTDFDGEVLEPKGFNLKPFLQQGFINWHHMRTPDGIIGEPLKAEIRNNELHIEAVLYPEQKYASDAFNLMNALDKASDTRKLGFSIEGNATKRAKGDKKHVLEADIVGCALTPLPKNTDTWADIVKGFVDDEDEPEEEKSLDTESGKVLMPESVDKKLKVLTKAQVFDKIFSHLPNITIQKAQELFNLIEAISTKRSKKMEGVTNEDLEKAYKTLGLPVPELNKGKGAKPDAVEAEEEAEEEGADTEKGKGKKKMDKGVLTDGELDSAIEKAQKQLDILSKARESRQPEKSGMEKQLEEISALLKGRSDREDALMTVVQNLTEEVTVLKKAVDQPIQKSQTRPQERFDKGQGNAGQQEGGLSLTSNKKQILSMMEHSFDKGHNVELGKSMAAYEGAGVLPPAHILGFLQNEYKVRITA